MESVQGAVAALSESGVATIRDLINRAFEAGVRVGRNQMRLSILAAADRPDADVVDVAPAKVAAPLVGVSGRALRGSVRHAVKVVLDQHPNGIATSQAEQAGILVDQSLSPRSIGGELRRMRDKLYRFDDGKWFLIAPKGEMETTEANAPAVPLISNSKEEPVATDNNLEA